MSTSSRTFTRKQVYHSDLRSKSPLFISLLSHPRPSKFRDRLPYCEFAVEGEAGIFELQVENLEVQRALSAIPLKTWVQVAASGTRDTAVLHVIKDPDITLPFPDAPGGEQTHAATAAPQSSASDAAEPSLARMYYEALSVAEKLIGAFRARHGREPSESERCVATSIFIQLCQSGGRLPLRRTSGED